MMKFIETFLMISLGIAFVLILLLIYHFRNKMNLTDKKTDTMFEIVQNMANEITVLKSNISIAFGKNNSFLNGNPDNIYVGKIIQENKNNLAEEQEQEDIHANDNNMSEDEDSSEDAVDDDNDDDEIYNSDDEDEDTDDEESGDEDDDVIQTEDERETNKIENNEMSFEKIEVLDDDTEKIKIININDTINLDEIAELKEYDNFEASSVMEDDKLDVEINEKEQNKIIVNKLQENENEDVKISEKPEEKGKKYDNKEIYKKMNVTELKAMVISKGLISDVSKLKKNDLIKILEQQYDEEM